MQDRQPNLLTRDDTFFGVCEGLGEDLHIPADLLRVALAGLMFWSPTLAIALYVALGAVVAATRLLFPAPRAPRAAAPAQPLAVEEEPETVPLAA